MDVIFVSSFQNLILLFDFCLLLPYIPPNDPPSVWVFICLFIICWGHHTACTQHHLMRYLGRLLEVMRCGFCFVKFPPVQGLIVQQQCFASSSISTINQPACFFISSCNGHCMFGTYWLAIGSTCLFINLATIGPGVRNICLSQVGWNTERLKWFVLPPPGKVRHLVSNPL